MKNRIDRLLLSVMLICSLFMDIYCTVSESKHTVSVVLDDIGEVEGSMAMGRKCKKVIRNTVKAKLDILEDEKLVTNLYDHGWVAKYPRILANFTNLTLVDVERYWKNESVMYAVVGTTSEYVWTNQTTGKNTTFVNFTFRLIWIDYSNLTVSGKFANVTYGDIAWVNVSVNKSYEPYLVDLDSTILENGSLIFAASIMMVFGALRISNTYIFKYDNVSIPHQNFSLMDLIEFWEFYGYYHFVKDLSINHDRNDTILAMGIGYYVDVSGILYTYFAVWLRYYPYPKNASYVVQRTQGFWIYRIKAISEVYLRNNVTYVASTFYYTQLDQDAIAVIAWNITSGNISMAGFALAAMYTDVMGDVPEYKYISLGLYNNTTDINLISIWEGHTDVKQYLFYATCSVFFWKNQTSGSTSINVSVIDYGPITSVYFPSQIRNLDTDYEDEKTAFIMVEYDPPKGLYTASHLLFRYNSTIDSNETYIFGGTYLFDLGDKSISRIWAVVNSSLDIYGIVYLPKPDGVEMDSLIIFRDGDRDYLGDWEEVNVYNTKPLDSDSDDDGIVDGSEEYIYSTDALDDDTDNDGLDDRFEIEVRPDVTYPEYGGITNKYSTDPLDNDTDNDRLDDYMEVTGNYTIDGRPGYMTNPVSRDTDGDGLSDYREIVLGVKYWVNDSANTFTAYPNATINDTDGDNLTDRYEAFRQLNPTSNDTDGDGLLSLIHI